MPYKNLYYILLFFAVLTAIAGLSIPVMDVDAAQYASISNEITETGSILKIYNGGRNYLDKPPLLFWLSALCMKILGSSTWVYKLPSLIFALLAAKAVYALGKQLYNAEAGIIASLMWLGCQGFFLMSQDVRTDLLLTSNIVLAVWQFYNWQISGKLSSILWAGFFTGCAMLAKGPLGLILPGVIIGISILSRGDLRKIFSLKTWLWIPICALCLLPMCIGLWQQHGSEGLYFFFWKQSFGRITGENEWKNGAGPFYLTQNLLWAVLPWTVLLVCSVLNALKKLLSIPLKTNSDLVPLVGILFPLLALSSSSYQLPHYIFVALPFAAILMAGWLQKIFLQNNPGKWVQYLKFWMIFQSVLAIVAAILLEFFIFSSDRWEFRVFWIGLILGCIYLFRGSGITKQLFYFPAAVWILVNMYLNFSLYPALMRFQPSIRIGEWFQQNQVSPEKLFAYQYGASHSLDFYTGKTNFVLYQPGDLDQFAPDYLVSNPEGFRELLVAGKNVRILRVYPDYPVQFLSLPFLNPATRSAQIKKFLLIQVY